MYGLRRLQDGATPIRVLARLDRAPGQQIDRAPEDALQILLEIEELEAELYTRREGDEQIHVAIGTEVVTKH